MHHSTSDDCAHGVFFAIILCTNARVRGSVQLREKLLLLTLNICVEISALRRKSDAA
jgi:hypothetical protein